MSGGKQVPVDGFRKSRIQRRNVVRSLLIVIVATVAFAVVPPTGAANAAGSVNLETSLSNAVDLPVPGMSDLLFVAVNNLGTASATNVVTNVPVPAGSTVDDLSDNCTVVSGHITCTFATLAPDETQGARIYLTFAAAGIHSVTSSAHADQPDADGNSADQLNVNVVAENADLTGTSEHARVVLGSQTTYNVSHQFHNAGPTAAANATVTGTVTGGGTIVASSFKFLSDYFNALVNLADDDCTVTATTFTCTPVFSGGVFYAPQPSVFYDVRLPTTPGTVVASAKLTGHADPNHSNDTSKITIDVDQPAAEIYTQLTPVSGFIASSQSFALSGPVASTGELAAANLVATLTVPASWGIALPAGPLPPGVACTIQASTHAMRCTRATFPASTSWDVRATTTPPAGTGTGTVTLSVTTTSAEIGVYPNDASEVIAFRPGGQTRTLAVVPNTGLAGGATVTVSGTNFGANSSIAVCEGITSPAPPRCGAAVHTTTADANGHFQTTMGVDRFLVVIGVGVIDCAQPQSSCGIGALDLSAGGNSVVAPIAFTPQPPVDDPFNARIIGRVTGTNGTPVAGAPVWAYRATDGWVGSVRTTTDENGDYVLEDAEPGIAYRLVFGAPPGSGLVAEWYGGPSSGGSPTRKNAFDVTLSANTPVVSANATLESGGSITGTVVDQTGAPVANVVVWGYRNDNGYVGSYATTTAADGTYRIAGIAPNTPLRLHFVPVVASGLQSEWFDNSPTRAAATPISVTAGATVTTHAQLDPLP